MLARLAEIDAVVREAYGGFDFGKVNSTLFNFCTNDLSAFYFDIRKDALYCDAATAPRRRAARTVIDEVFRRIVTWYAPILCFTMEEAWTARFGMETSVHLQDFVAVPAGWADAALIEKWKRVRELRRVVTGALELERAGKKIGSSLEAAPALVLEDRADAGIVQDVAFAEVAITSGLSVLLDDFRADDFRLPDVPGVAVRFAHATGE
jgi:isoleucyl-tRNA synthetase